MSTQDFLRATFDDRFSARSLSPERTAALKRYISERIGTVDGRGEGFVDHTFQRDLSVKYHWGHNHRLDDEFTVQGRMGDRHIDIVARFMDRFGLERDLSGLTILDIGCWTGGVSLLLTALGARVIAIDEVRKYVDTVNVLAETFSLGDRLVAVPESLYDFLPKYADHFDMVIYSGVIYHVTDPLLSLRQIFSALKDGGRCFIETAGTDAPGSLCRYEGPSRFYRINDEELSRGGWNYFLPTPECLRDWCLDVGFAEADIGEVVRDERIHGVARRGAFRDFLRAGLSARNTR
ncbi:class I SAM-dependent methyltransferase [Arenibaculum pallidiluteum]|uniref:class I SAM-dependent methyltransferase n=1 Tax=Arenibaculum pallidiluteum TaxID=2812559 RepID=UPI001A963E60|nr:methyltransferase domain-containing protein [Arenibaculum pallidiluteum]